MVLRTLPVLLVGGEAMVVICDPIATCQTRRLSAQKPHGQVRTEEEAFLGARSLLNQGRFQLAADGLRSLRQEFPQGEHTVDAFYWEAYARHRLGRLREAVALLDTAHASIPGAPPPHSALVVYPGRNDDGHLDSGAIHRIRDIRQLRVRILGELAEQGDSRAAAEMLRLAESALEETPITVATAEDSVLFADSVVGARNWSVDADRLAEWHANSEEWQAQREEWQAQREELEAKREELEAKREGAQWEEFEAQREELETKLEEAQWEEGDLSFSIDLPADYRGRFEWSSSAPRSQDGCGDESFQQEVLSALMRLETDRLSVLRSVLERTDGCSANLRRQAVERLGREGTPEAERELVAVASSHPAAETRRAAVYGLRRFRTPSALGALATLLMRSKDVEMQEAAIRALRRSGHGDAAKALDAFARDTSKPEDVRKQAVKALGRRDDVDIGMLVRLYLAVETEQLKVAVLERMRRRAGEVGDETATWLLGLVLDESASSGIRSSALEVWWRSPAVNTSHIVEVYRRLGDPDQRERIFYALHRKAGSDEGNAPATVRTMIELARTETDRDVRGRAVHWLGRTGSPEAVEFLFELLHGPQPDTVSNGNKPARRK